MIKYNFYKQKYIKYKSKYITYLQNAGKPESIIRELITIVPIYNIDLVLYDYINPEKLDLMIEHLNNNRETNIDTFNDLPDYISVSKFQTSKRPQLIVNCNNKINMINGMGICWYIAIIIMLLFSDISNYIQINFFSIINKLELNELDTIQYNLLTQIFPNDYFDVDNELVPSHMLTIKYILINVYKQFYLMIQNKINSSLNDTDLSIIKQLYNIDCSTDILINLFQLFKNEKLELVKKFKEDIKKYVETYFFLPSHITKISLGMELNKIIMYLNFYCIILLSSDISINYVNTLSNLDNYNIIGYLIYTKLASGRNHLICIYKCNNSYYKCDNHKNIEYDISNLNKDYTNLNIYEIILNKQNNFAIYKDIYNLFKNLYDIYKLDEFDKFPLPPYKNNDIIQILNILLKIIKINLDVFSIDYSINKKKILVILEKIFELNFSYKYFINIFLVIYERIIFIFDVFYILYKLLETYDYNELDIFKLSCLSLLDRMIIDDSFIMLIENFEIYLIKDLKYFDPLKLKDIYSQLESKYNKSKTKSYLIHNSLKSKILSKIEELVQSNDLKITKDESLLIYNLFF